MMDPQPVVKNAAATALALVILTEVASFTSYMGWWSPSGEDLLQFASVAGVLVGIVLLVQGWLVHKQVTPNEKVALTKADVKLLDAAQKQPRPITSPAPARVAVKAPRKRIRKATS